MPESAPNVPVLLLVEDNPDDAELVRELLHRAGENFRVMHAPSLAAAEPIIAAGAVDVLLLDLDLPDGAGTDSVVRVRETNSHVPIVVLTGTEDEALAIACIDAGAQDYLCKGQLKASALRRAIHYSIRRRRQGQARDLEETMARYRTLSSPAAGTSVPAATGALRERYPNAFDELVVDYVTVLSQYIDVLLNRAVKPREEMERVVTRLGDASAGPRDLVDVHLAALDRTIPTASRERCRALSVEGRLLALEMMGLLVDYYRTIARRRVPERKPP